MRARLSATAQHAPGLVAIAAMAVVGIAIAVYLTAVHYTHTAAVCTTVGPINCTSVLQSRYSLVPGTELPITLPGLLWFAVSGGLALVGLRAVWRGEREPEWLRLAMLAWSAAGLAFVLYLVFVEIVVVGAICEWCTAVHLLTLATFLVALHRWQTRHATPIVSTPARQTAAGSNRQAVRGDQRRHPAQGKVQTQARQPDRAARQGQRAGRGARMGGNASRAQGKRG
ncbi:MAG TPA: vitamin K epoxide reductase family protein [Ktedonobacterales bacterium]|nr:vitamin K epoxide reductase family protein [Ktedonobacterales bacterium]